MNPITVKDIRTIIDGELIQGSDDAVVEYGAYRLKQIHKKNTILFAKYTIRNWTELEEFFPLIVVTHKDYKKTQHLENLTIIEVESTENAYWEFLTYYRNQFDIPVVAVTGTTGKTTTKEMIRHILSKNKKVAATKKTNNSRTAHLQYLLSIDDDTEAAVFEAAVGSPGDVLYAGEYFKPTIGIITNIGAHHLRHCESIESYIEAKGDMAKILDHKGVLIINQDDINTKKIDFTDFKGKIIKVGKGHLSDFRATDINFLENGMHFNLLHNQQSYPVYVPGLGEHQVYNALAALAAVYETGIGIQEAVIRLKTFQKFDRQLQVVDGINGSVLIDDTWSLTSTSLEAAIKVLEEIGKGKKKIAVVGSITGLGSWGKTINQQAGEMIAEHSVDILIVKGNTLASIMADQAKKNNPELQVYSINKSSSVYRLLKKIVDENTIVLFKGNMYSKGMVNLASKFQKKE
ncbi:Mur ligase family protein [Jeotgalibacillus proteolyticus]|uniref:UDP-N-acetylmuramoyl-tripeptide--D-alanyl-D-alanine ligase n=1 Tax=Jeotgalibacillus proteolyticus TaxID=2082395 RepID=A0A2S5G7Q0_9BACL|nr:Mur ligase family protein [Jeotgalibacillus proteolyticus]PPA68951.1 UDP-N-acetylmuramoyl-tripeptide--D-alanyl-D-alanine ligase [Jeotgalibacillus proteolyticus]